MAGLPPAQNLTNDRKEFFLSHEVTLSFLSEASRWQAWRPRSCESSQRPWKQVMDCREQGRLVGEHTAAEYGRDTPFARGWWLGGGGGPGSVPMGSQATRLPL